MTNIHASCVKLARAGEAFGAPPDAGVLLLGDSGAGKSATALALIAMGARLVSDDRTELFVREQILWGRAPARLAGLIEARGVGIVTLPHDAEAPIALAVELVAAGAAPRFPAPQRLGMPDALAPSVAARPPLLRLAPDGAAVKIVLAVAAFANALFRDEGNPP